MSQKSPPTRETSGGRASSPALGSTSSGRSASRSETTCSRRAGLGYWHSLDVTTYAGWEEFLAQNGLGETDERLHLLTKKARKTYTQATYADGDFLVFGKESTGLPEELLARAASRCERHSHAV